MHPLRSEKTSILKVLKNQLFALVIPRFRVPTVQGKWFSGYRLALENQRFPVQVRLLAVGRGEPSAVIARLNVKCL